MQSKTVPPSSLSNFVHRAVLCLSVALFTATAPAAVLVSGFDGYNNGNLIGQVTPEGQTWTYISGSTPILNVTNGNLAINATGVDAYVGLGGSYTSGSILYYGLTLNLTAATVAGDLFASLTGADGSVLGWGRLFAKSSGSGFVLGVQRAGSDTVIYGTTELAFNSDYRIVYHYTIQATNLNQSILYVNPENLSNEGANTIYSQTPTGGGGTDIRNFQLWQNNNSPTGTISDLAVTTTFSEAAIPEPSAFAMLGLGVVAVIILRRSQKRTA